MPAAPRGGRGRLRADGAAARGPRKGVAELPRGQGCRRGERLTRAGAWLPVGAGLSRRTRAPSAPGLAAGVWASRRCVRWTLSLSASLRCPGGECDPQHVYFHEVLLRKRHPPLPVPTDALSAFSRSFRDPKPPLLAFVCIQL